MKPIIFSTDMVKAILSGAKTQTRRVIKEAKADWVFCDLSEDMAITAIDRYGNEYGKPVDGLYATFEDSEGYIELPVAKSKYRVGDILWGRENFVHISDIKGFRNYAYKTDHDANCFSKWRSSIHMPREAARIFLRVTDVRVERLQSITPADCRAEGISATAHPFDDLPMAGSTLAERHVYTETGLLDDDSPWWREWYSTLWDSINSKRGFGWKTNPWVWAYTFERCEKPEGEA